jgi:SAM-dependent methyltransferase
MASGGKNSIEISYDKQADVYNQFIKTPLGTLEQQLFDLSIRNCDGLKVLDLGGGGGLRARDALRAGAVAVDVVDISPEMMRHGRQYEKSIGRECINWYQGDASKSLDHLPLCIYDMVIANGIFDHARNLQELKGMWHNAAAYLKPGGRLIANRNNPLSPAAADGKYGVKFTNFQNFPEGLAFRYSILTDPPLEFDLTPLETYYSGSLEIPGKYFKDFQNVSFEQTPVVREDPGFWKSYLDQPILFIFTAKKHE